MSDFADNASEITQGELDRNIAAAKAAASNIEAGQAGDCDACGEHFSRVVERQGGQYCGKCRDKYNLG